MGAADAVYLLERIEHLGVGEVSERDLRAATKHRFAKKIDLLPALGAACGVWIPGAVARPGLAANSGSFTVTRATGFD